MKPKRILALLLSLTVLLSSLPVFSLTSFAAGGVVASVTTESGITEYESLANAFTAAKNASGSTLKLLDDIPAESAIIVTSGKFTIDLNGKTWKSSDYVLGICGTADIKITDTASGGTMKTTGETYPTITLYGTAKLEIAGGTIEGNELDAVDMSASGNATSSQLVLSGGTLKTLGYYVITAHCSSVTMTNDAKIESGSIYYQTGTIDLSGHSDPTGIGIENFTGAAVIPGETTVKLPKGYRLFDEDNNIASELAADETYTIDSPNYDITITGWIYGSYDEQRNAPKVTGISGGGSVTYYYKLTSQDDTAYTTEVPTQAGNYTVKAVVKNSGYEDTIEVATEFSIGKKSISIGATAENKVYDKTTAAKVSPVIDERDLVPGDVITITGLIGTFDDANAGEYNNVSINSENAVVTGADNYEVTFPTSAPAKIDPKPLSDEDIKLLLTPDIFSFDGNQKTVSVTVTHGDDPLTNPTDYTVEGTVSATEISRGDGYKVTVKGTGNYTDSRIAFWSIEKAIMQVTADSVETDYDEKEHSITISGTPDGSVISYGTVKDSYDLTENPKFINAGTYPVFYKVTCDDYKDFEGMATVTINKIDQPAPEAPVKKTATTSEITLNEITAAGYGDVQYAYNTKNEAPADAWQHTPVFTGLSKGTEYYFFARYAGDQNHNISPASKGTAIKTLDTCTVTFEENGGSEVEAAEVTHGETVSKPATPTRSGYSFNGWYTDSELKNAYDFTSKVTEDMTLYAKWTAKTVSYTGGGSSGVSRYTVSFETNGGSEVEEQTVTRNSTVKKPAAPAKDGSLFDGWYTDKELKNAYDFTSKVTEDMTLYAKWAEDTVPDTLNGETHFAYVFGYPDGTVRPTDNISRAEVAAIFFRLLKEDVRNSNLTENNSFEDVAPGTWYNTAVSSMAKLNIIVGRTPNRFVPDDFITRAEFAAICARFDDSEYEVSDSFTDIGGHWAETEIREAAAHGWISGYEDGSFKPDAFITRAEAMTMINRVLNRTPESADDLHSDMRTWSDNSDESVWYYLPVQEATNSHEYSTKGNSGEKWISVTNENK